MPNTGAINHTPGVCGGSACIRDMRMPVWLLEECRRGGWPDNMILDAYPDLTADDLTNAWAYVSAHGEEIDAEIQDNDIENDVEEANCGR